MKSMEVAYWINEREQMRLRKESADCDEFKYGYSDDPIMGTTRWCNVHREDDKVTRWMRKNWSDASSPLWWFVLGRMVNYIPTLKILLPVRDWKGGSPIIPRVNHVLKERRKTGEKVFTSAYTISTCGKSMDKIDYVTDWVCAAVQDTFGEGAWLREKDTLACWFSHLTSIDGLGSFLAGQVLADLKNTPGHPLQTALDRATWATHGPGSLRGLSAFWMRPCTPSTFTADLHNMVHAVQPHIDEMPPIDMQDWQNVMCEFGKYTKLKEGRGHARNRYHAQ